MELRQLNHRGELRVVESAFAIHRRAYGSGERKIFCFYGLQLLQHNRWRVEMHFVGFGFRSVREIRVDRSGRDRQIQCGNDGTVGGVEFRSEVLNGLVVGSGVGDLRRTGPHRVKLRTLERYFRRQVSRDWIVLVRQTLQVGDPDLLGIEMRFNSIRILVRPIPQGYASAESRPPSLGIDECSALYREL